MEKTEMHKILSDAYREHRESLVSEICLYTHDYALAEDSVQDALCALQNKLSHEFAGEIDTQAFLFAVAKKAAFKYVDVHSTEVFLEDVSVLDGIVCDDTLADEMAFIENEELLLKVLHSLPPNTRRIFVLHHLNGMSYKSIGKKLGLSSDAVRKTVNRSLQVLRNEMLKD